MDQSGTLPAWLGDVLAWRQLGRKRKSATNYHHSTPARHDERTDVLFIAGKDCFAITREEHDCCVDWVIFASLAQQLTTTVTEVSVNANDLDPLE